LYAQAEEEFDQAGDSKNALRARLGRLRAQMQSASCTELSREIDEILGNAIVETDPELKLQALAYKGEIAHQCDLWVAKEAWEEVLRLSKATGNKAWEARATGELGVLTYVVGGDGARATLLIGKALFKVAETQDSWAEATYLTHTGNSLSMIGRHEIALKYFEKALTAARRQPDSPFPLTVYIGKARTLLEMGRDAQAKLLLREALQQATLMNYRISETELLILQAKLAMKANNTALALESLTHAIRISNEGNFGRALANAHWELAILHRKLGDLHQAEIHLGASIETMKRMGDTCDLPHRMKDLALLRVQQGKLTEASALYDEISDITEGMIASANTEYVKSSLIGSLSDVQLSYFNLVADKLNDPVKAFAALERARGRTISDALQARPGDTEENSAKATVEREISLLNKQLLHSTSPPARAALLRQIVETEQKLAPAIAEHNQFRKAVTGGPVPLQTLQQGLGKAELLLEYVVDEPTSHCLLITRDDIWLTHIAGRSQLDSLVDRFLREVRAKANALDERKQLYNLLLKSIETKRFSRLIIVPDGNLHLLPFDALVDRSGRSVLETHLVSYVPSGTALHLLRTTGQPRGPARKFPGVGGVLYSSNGRPSIPAQARTLFRIETAKIGTLPGSEREVLSIGRMFAKDAVLLTGREATESALKKQRLEDFQVVHLAVHGFSDLKFPERTALVLAEDRKSAEDGLLQDREIRDLRFSADLVTLSACDAGIGRLQGQEGISNLVSSFFLAGAKTVVASLWNADDDATTNLMKRFYSYLEKGEDKASALRHAKLELMRQFGADAVPYYWAGFTLHGQSASSLHPARY
jgi:CHAT domain-containing protein